MQKLFDIISPAVLLVVVVAMAVLIVLGATLCVMIYEYRSYLADHPSARYSSAEFVRQGRFYIYLFLAVTFIIIQNLWFLLVM